MVLFPYDYYASLNLIYSHVRGDFSYFDLLQHPQVFMRDPKFRPGVNVIYDCSDVQRVIAQPTLLQNSRKLLSDAEFLPVPANTVFIATPAQTEAFPSLLLICDALRETRVVHHVAGNVEDALKIVSLTADDFMQVKRRDFSSGQLDTAC